MSVREAEKHPFDFFQRDLFGFVGVIDQKLGAISHWLNSHVHTEKVLKD